MPYRARGRTFSKKVASFAGHRSVFTHKMLHVLQGTGVYLRGSKLKMPASVGNKKSKAVEQLLEELSVDVVPMPTEQICNSFNELRNQLLLLYELRQVKCFPGPYRKLYFSKVPTLVSSINNI